MVQVPKLKAGAIVYVLTVCCLAVAQTPAGQAPANATPAAKPKKAAPAKTEQFAAAGDFTALLDDPKACAASLASFHVLQAAQDLKLTLEGVCPDAVYVSVPVGKKPAGVLQKDGSKTTIPLAFGDKAADQMVEISGNFGALLDRPEQCLGPDQVTAYAAASDKPLAKVAVVSVCAGKALLRIPGSVGAAATGYLERAGKAPVSLTFPAAAAASSAASAKERIFGATAASGDFRGMLTGDACATKDALKDFSVILMVDGKSVGPVAVLAVCPEMTYLSTSAVADGQAPTGGLLRGRTSSVELKLDGKVYVRQVVSLTAPGLSSLCGSDPTCRSVAPLSIRVTLAPANGLKESVAGAIVLESIRPDVAVVSFLAVADYKVAMAVLSVAPGPGTGIVARPLAGTPAERVLVAHGNFVGMAGFAGGQECVSDKDLANYSGFIYSQQSFVAATVRAVCRNRVYFSTQGLDEGQKVSGGFIQVSGKQAVPLQFDTIPYQTFVLAVGFINMTDLCGQPACGPEQVQQMQVTLVPGPQSTLTGGEDPQVVAVDNSLAILRFYAPGDFDLQHVNIRLKDKVVYARLLPGPHPARGQPNVTFTIVPHDSVSRNFGKPIADHYIVIDLMVKNPGVKKIQVKRSAIWFEVDYADAKPHQNTTTGKPEFYHHLYGLDHVEQATPEDWLTVLGVYDGYATIKQFLGPKSIDGILAVLTALSGTAIRSKGLAQVLPKFTGLIAPAAKDWFWNDEEDKRRRTNLLSQSLTDLVQVPAGSVVATKVFLPRVFIEKLFLTDKLKVEASVSTGGISTTVVTDSVVIESVRNVHVDLEVIDGTAADTVAKGQVTAGMTKEQVVQALGIPDSKTDGSAGASVWTYKSGNYSTVTFGTDGKVQAFEQRTSKDQLDQMTGKATTAEVKELLGMTQDPSNAQSLWDGGVIWPKPSGIERTLRFNQDRKLIDANYTIVSDKQNGFTELVGMSEADVAAKLAGYFPDGKAQRPAVGTGPATSKTYASPDLQGQTVVVTFGSDGKAADVKVSPAKL